MNAPQHTERFSALFRALMVFCVLVWLWGLGLFMLWPWQQGGQWLPDYPLPVRCADGQTCAVPVGQLAAARADGRVSSLLPQESSGETTYEMLTVRWKLLADRIEVKTSAWNFQTTVRYRIDSEQPVLIEYQEIGGKVFLYALAGALISLALLYLNRRRQRG